MSKPLRSILDVPMRCPVCGFRFPLGAGAPAVDNGSGIGCPICFAVASEDKDGKRA